MYDRKQGRQQGATTSPSVAEFAMGLLKWAAVNFEEMICAIFLTIMVVAVSLGVLFRYVLNSPLSWPEEIARYSLVWLTFIGASLATKRGIHIVVDFMGVFLCSQGKNGESMFWWKRSENSLYMFGKHNFNTEGQYPR